MYGESHGRCTIDAASKPWPRKTTSVFRGVCESTVACSVSDDGCTCRGRGRGGEGMRRRRAGGGAMRARPPNQRRRPFVRAPGAHRAAHVVPHRAEEDEVELELRVVEAVVRAGVQQPLERPLLRPARDELEVAVADAVEHVEEGEVEVDEGEGEAAAPRRHEEGEREVGEVAHALEQRVRRARDRLGDDRGVVVLVRRLVHLRVVQEAVEDVVERLRRRGGGMVSTSRKI